MVIIVNATRLRLVDRRYEPEEGGWILLAGLVIVWAVCLGIPWVLRSGKPR